MVLIWDPLWESFFAQLDEYCLIKVFFKCLSPMALLSVKGDVIRIVLGTDVVYLDSVDTSVDKTWVKIDWIHWKLNWIVCHLAIPAV